MATGYPDSLFHRSFSRVKNSGRLSKRQAARSGDEGLQLALQLALHVERAFGEASHELIVSKVAFGNRVVTDSDCSIRRNSRLSKQPMSSSHS